MSNPNNQTIKVKTPNPTFKLCKDFASVLVLEGRDKLADGLYAVAEKVDITTEQEHFCANFHRELEIRKAEKERSKLNVAGAKA